MKQLPKETKRDRAYIMRVWRAQRDLSAAQAAEVFEIDASTWSLLESGKRHASPALAKDLAKAMGQSIEMFLNMEAR